MITNNLITTKELVRVSGYSSASLKKYADMGWLPAPELKSYQKGGGSTLWWDRICLVRLSTIKTLKKTGRTIEEIDEILMKGE